MSDDMGLLDILIIAGMFGGGFFLTWMFVGAMKDRDRPPSGPVDRKRDD
ncbi:hypothetical protein [Dongia sp.]